MARIYDGVIKVGYNFKIKGKPITDSENVATFNDLTSIDFVDYVYLYKIVKVHDEAGAQYQLIAVDSTIADNWKKIGSDISVDGLLKIKTDGVLVNEQETYTKTTISANRDPNMNDINVTTANNTVITFVVGYCEWYNTVDKTSFILTDLTGNLLDSANWVKDNILSDDHVTKLNAITGYVDQSPTSGLSPSYTYVLNDENNWNGNTYSYTTQSPAELGFKAGMEFWNISNTYAYIIRSSGVYRIKKILDDTTTFIEYDGMEVGDDPTQEIVASQYKKMTFIKLYNFTNGNAEANATTLNILLPSIDDLYRKTMQLALVDNTTSNNTIVNICQSNGAVLIADIQIGDLHICTSDGTLRYYVK